MKRREWRPRCSSAWCFGLLTLPSVPGCVDAGTGEPEPTQTPTTEEAALSSTMPVREGFEGTELGRAPSGWVVGGYGNRTVGVTDALAARGGRSLRIEVAGDQAAVVGMLTRRVAGELGVAHHGRVFMRIEGPGASQFVHFDAFEGSGPWDGQNNAVRWASTGTSVGNEPRNWSWIYNVQPTEYGEFGSEGPRSAHPRVDDWMCLEWAFDSAAQEARFWFDGAEVEYLHLLESAGARTEIPVFRSLAVGFQKFQLTDGFVVWIDEVAFDRERVGCE